MNICYGKNSFWSSKYGIQLFQLISIADYFCYEWGIHHSLYLLYTSVSIFYTECFCIALFFGNFFCFFSEYISSIFIITSLSSELPHFWRVLFLIYILTTLFIKYKVIYMCAFLISWSTRLKEKIEDVWQFLKVQINLWQKGKGIIPFRGIISNSRLKLHLFRT